eukprot:876505-Alexandrium_andersonii.AAC.1
MPLVLSSEPRTARDRRAPEVEVAAGAGASMAPGEAAPELMVVARLGPTGGGAGRRQPVRSAVGRIGSRRGLGEAT